MGTRLLREFGWGRAALTARVGTARVAPDIDLTLQRNHPGHLMLVSFYRSLRDGQPGEGGGTPGIYVTGDAEDFHWSRGAAVRFLPPLGERNWLPHARAVVEGTLVMPLFSRLFLGMQAGIARVWGDPAPHDLWRIAASGRWLRGHGESVRGARVHMARVDLRGRVVLVSGVVPVQCSKSVTRPQCRAAWRVHRRR